jgi:hypothetical protein
LVLVTLDRFDEAGAEAVSYKMLCPRCLSPRRFSVSYKMLCPRRFRRTIRKRAIRNSRAFFCYLAVSDGCSKGLAARSDMVTDV